MFFLSPKLSQVILSLRLDIIDAFTVKANLSLCIWAEDNMAFSIINFHMIIFTPIENFFSHSLKLRYRLNRLLEQKKINLRYLGITPYQDSLVMSRLLVAYAIECFRKVSEKSPIYFSLVPRFF